MDCSSQRRLEPTWAFISSGLPKRTPTKSLKESGFVEDQTHPYSIQPSGADDLLMLTRCCRSRLTRLDCLRDRSRKASANAPTSALRFRPVVPAPSAFSIRSRNRKEVSQRRG